MRRTEARIAGILAASSRRSVFPTPFPRMPHCRHQRNDDHSRDHIMNPLVDVRHRLAERISKQHGAPHPKASAGNVVRKITRVAHPRSACHRWAECADNRDEARQDDSLAAVMLVKFVSLLQMPLLEKA